MSKLTDDLKAQLNSIEKELDNLTVKKPEGPFVTPVEKPQRCKITKESFLAAQGKPPADEGFLTDLLSRGNGPRPNRRHTVSLPRSEGDTDQSSNDLVVPVQNFEEDDRLAGLRAVRSDDRKRELVRVFDERLRDEKRKCKEESQHLLNQLESQMRESRRKWQAERERMQEALHQQETIVKSTKLEAHRLSEANRILEGKLHAVSVAMDEKAVELDAADKDLINARAQLKEATDREMELTEKMTQLKVEFQELSSKAVEADRELRKLRKDGAAAACREREYSGKVETLSSQLNELRAESARWRDECRRATHELSVITGERNELEAKANELAQRVQSLEMENREHQRVIKRQEDEASHMRAYLEQEKMGKDKAERGLRDWKMQAQEFERWKSQFERLSEEHESLRDYAQGLESEVRGQQDRLTELQKELEAERAGRASTTAELARSHRLIRELRAQGMTETPSRRIRASPTNPAPPEDVDLLDSIEGHPIPRLGGPHADDGGPHRPYWWRNVNSTLRRGEEYDFVVPASRARVPARDSPPIPSPGPRLVSNVTPVVSNHGERDLLLAEKRRLEAQLESYPKNPAFRTSAENEDYLKIAAELEVVTTDLQSFDNLT